MSYLNYIINPYQCNTINTKSYSLSHRLQTQKLIQLLSFALEKSIISYEQRNYAPSNTPISTKLHPINHQITKKEETQNIIEILSDDQQHIRNQLKINVSLPPQQLNKQNSPIIKTQDQTPTIEESHRQIENKTKIAEIKTKKIKKSQKKQILPDFHVQIPQIDLIEASKIPKFQCHKPKLMRKAQNLLRRQVYEWVPSSKKHKRQANRLNA